MKPTGPTHSAMVGTCEPTAWRSGDHDANGDPTGIAGGNAVVHLPCELRLAKVATRDEVLLVLSYSLALGLGGPALTEAEKVVVRLASLGMSNRAIALVRDCAQRTVANQLASAYRKLGGVSRASLHSALAFSTAPGESHAGPR